ncbi:MAG TPA: glycosyltransferase 87 family protein [Gaiellaceae bacterium]|nr:glycosyltransferase 87 family protein [Gaiellaceae bacterium]
MIGVALILAAILTSLLASSSLRLGSLVSTLLVAYLAFVANLGLVTLVLSPFREVTQGGLAVAEAALLLASISAWLWRNRPGLPLAAAKVAARSIASSPLTLFYLLAVLVALAYELFLGLTVPPNNWDSLTYHLAKVAAWAHHGGIYWIPNAPTGRLNEFQPLAEQQNLFLFAATHRDVLYALPQFLAELAILLAVYGSARRLGFEVRAAACSAFLLATFPLIALEASTAQNDLVVASLPAAAVCLLLGGPDIETVVAGVAVGMSVGAKLTAVLVFPALVWLTLARGRRAFVLATLGTVAGFVAVGGWGFVLNVMHTGHVLGYGDGRTEHTTSPGYPRSLVTALSILYETMDLSALWHLLIHLLFALGVVAALLVAAYVLLRRRSGLRSALVTGGAVAIPFVSPVLVMAGGAILAFLTRRLGTPVRGTGGAYGELNNSASEDSAAFGPIGGVVLLAAPVFVAAGYFARRIDVRQLMLACVLPVFLILLSLETQFNSWLPRFLVLPVVMTAPLLAWLFRDRLVMTAFIAVSVLILGLVVTRDITKPLESPFGHPWQISWSQALIDDGQPLAAAALVELDRAVPQNACVGAVFNGDSPAYLVYGRDFHRDLVYLRVQGVDQAAKDAHLGYVVVSTNRQQQPAVRELRAAGWTTRRLGVYWTLAEAPAGTAESCA